MRTVMGGSRFPNLRHSEKCFVTALSLARVEEKSRSPGASKKSLRDTDSPDHLPTNPCCSQIHVAPDAGRARSTRGQEGPIGDPSETHRAPKAAPKAGTHAKNLIFCMGAKSQQANSGPNSSKIHQKIGLRVSFHLNGITAAP